MAYKIVLQPRAKADLETSYRYIADHAPDAAIRWYEGIKTAINSLTDMPGRCGDAPESAALQYHLKQLHYGRRTGIYRIIFRIIEDSEEVHILALRHAAREVLEIKDLE